MKRYMIPRVANCCRGSIIGRVAPALQRIKMNKYLLREFHALCEGGICQDFLTEAEKRMVNEEGAVFLTGIIQCAEQKNGNGRIYPRPVLEREVQKYQALVKERRALGELDHPEDSVINLKNASHLITEMWWDGDSVMGKIEVLDTFVINSVNLTIFTSEH